jgi:hypothetical protein
MKWLMVMYLVAGIFGLLLVKKVADSMATLQQRNNALPPINQ